MSSFILVVAAQRGMYGVLTSIIISMRLGILSKSGYTPSPKMFLSIPQRSSHWKLLFFMFWARLGLNKAEANVWNYPRKTSDAKGNGGALRVEPTAAPTGNPELFKRQGQPYSAICGYVTGDIC
jgi:hypothetical protein